MALVAVVLGACGGGRPQPAAPPPQPPAPPPVEPVAPAPAAALNDDEAKRFADLLTSEDPGPSADDMGRRPSGSDLSKQIEEVKRGGGKSVAIGGGASRASRETGTPKSGTGNGPRLDGPVEPTPPGPSARVIIGGATTADATSLTREMVLAKIQAAYMAGVKRCYKAHLQTDPTSRGRVVLKFEVTAAGRAHGTASGLHKDVDSCITGLINVWTFPPPKDREKEATEATFEITLNLVPD